MEENNRLQMISQEEDETMKLKFILRVDCNIENTVTDYYIQIYDEDLLPLCVSSIFATTHGDMFTVNEKLKKAIPLLISNTDEIIRCYKNIQNSTIIFIVSEKLKSLITLAFLFTED